MKEHVAVVVSDSDEEVAANLVANRFGCRTTVLHHPTVEKIAKHLPDCILFDWSPAALARNTVLVRKIRAISALDATQIFIFFSSFSDLDPEIRSTANLHTVQIPFEPPVIDRIWHRLFNQGPLDVSSSAKQSSASREKAVPLLPATKLYQVFISHSVEDTSVAEALHDLLDHGLGLNRKQIFRSTEDGAIPSGHFFVEHILRALQQANCVLCLVTPTFLESSFCLGEIGAAQMRNVENPGIVHGLIVQPVSFTEATGGVLNGTQLGSARNLEAVASALRPLAVVDRSASEWKKKYETYIDKLHQLETRYLLDRNLGSLCIHSVELIKAPPADKYRSKLYIALENRAEYEITLDACRWFSGAGGVPLQESKIEHLSWNKREGSSWRNGEWASKSTVQPRGVIRTWIGLHESVNNAQLVSRLATKILGELRLRTTERDVERVRSFLL